MSQNLFRKVLSYFNKKSRHKAGHARVAHSIKRRGPLWILVHGTLWVLDRFIEFVLYPLTILLYGPVLGIGLMIVVSFFLCWILIVIYDHISENWLRDALGFETLKEAGSHAREWIKERFKFDISGPFFKILLFLYLSVRNDPMTTTIIMRPANHHRMGKQEWKIFVASVFVSCIGWGLIVYGLIGLFHVTLKHFQ